jgi:molybdenum cofactor cytidylyltransferase
MTFNDTDNRSSPNIVSIVLAAGESKRMGYPKALLKADRKTFVRTIIENHRNAGILKNIVVVGADREKLAAELHSLSVDIAYNENYKNGQLSSIQTGLACAAQFSPDAVLVHPVDHPLIFQDTITAMVKTFAATHPAIVIPTQRGRRGHPVIFSSGLFSELFSAPLGIGARFVVRNHNADVLEIETGDAGILNNIDTPEMYEHLRANLRSSSER